MHSVDTLTSVASRAYKDATAASRGGDEVYVALARFNLKHLGRLIADSSQRDRLFGTHYRLSDDTLDVLAVEYLAGKALLDGLHTPAKRVMDEQTPFEQLEQLRDQAESAATYMPINSALRRLARTGSISLLLEFYTWAHHQEGFAHRATRK